MRIGLFDPYLDDLGGGEKYMVSIAEYLSKNHSVSIFWNDPKDLQKLVDRFSLDVSKIQLTENIFSPQVSFWKRLTESRKYDAIIILSDGSLPVLLSKKVLIHFQQPFPNLNSTLKTNLKKFRVNSFFCNSQFTKAFIDKEFAIDSKVLYPLVEIKMRKVKKENIILHVGRFRVRDVTTNVSGKEVAIGDYKKQSVMLKVFKEMIAAGLKNWKFVLAIKR